MKIYNLMTKKPAILDETATVLDAVKKMESVGCGILPVGDSKNIKGVITDRDIMMRAVANDKNLAKTPVKDIMTKGVIFCDEEDDLRETVYQMNQHNIRRVFVKNKDHVLSGVISLGDIIRRTHDKALLASLFRETDIA